MQGSPEHRRSSSDPCKRALLVLGISLRVLVGAKEAQGARCWSQSVLFVFVMGGTNPPHPNAPWGQGALEGTHGDAREKKQEKTEGDVRVHKRRHEKGHSSRYRRRHVDGDRAGNGS